MGTTGFYPVSSLRLELQSTQRELLQERETTATYVRGVEDRAHREVDRVREESMAVAAQMKAASKHQEQLRQRLDTALAKLSEAQQLAAAEAARARPWRSIWSSVCVPSGSALSLPS